MGVRGSYGDVKGLKYCMEFWGGPDVKVVQYIDAIKGMGKERKHSLDRLHPFIPYIPYYTNLDLWHESKTCITKSELSKCPW